MLRPEHTPGRAISAAIAVTGALAGVAFAPAGAAASPTNPANAAECRAITDFELRGQCWDALDKVNQKDAQTAQQAAQKEVQAAKKKNFGLGAQAPKVAAVKPKKEKVKAPPKPENTEVNSLTLTIAQVDSTPRGQVLLTSTDGAIWEQTDGDSVPRPPSVGDTFRVSKGMLGGYMCQITHWQAVRCQRDK
jgi:hypothetical protein